MTIDLRAESGFAAVADAYERGRPGYPDEAINRIIGYFGFNDASAVLDLEGEGPALPPLRHRVRHVTLWSRHLPCARKSQSTSTT